MLTLLFVLKAATKPNLIFDHHMLWKHLFVKPLYMVVFFSLEIVLTPLGTIFVIDRHVNGYSFRI